MGFAVLMTYQQLSVNNEVILHFNTAGQPDFTGSQQDVLVILATGGGMLLVNLFLASILDRRENFLALIITGSSLLLSVLLFIATWAILVNNK